MAASTLRASLTSGVRALEFANAQLDLAHAERAVNALLHARGRRYFTGVGKSGLAAARMASSLTSIGLPSQWVHGTEWAHGELGGVGGGDVITMVSHSGKTSELLDLANELQGSSHLAGADDTSAITFVALTGDANSALAQLACVPLTCAVPDDAELLGVLPTASVLSAHHVFNAVLTECAARLELTPETIARHHPGGSIGRALR